MKCRKCGCKINYRGNYERLICETCLDIEFIKTKEEEKLFEDMKYNTYTYINVMEEKKK